MQLSVFRRAAAITLLLAACDSSTAPQPLTGLYVAQSAEGRAMPAVVDSAMWNDGETYTLYRLARASVEFVDGENARWTVDEQQVAYWRDQTLTGGSCHSVTMPYRRQGGRVVLVVEPALLGQTGPMRLDTLQLQNDQLEQTVKVTSGKTVRVRYARGQGQAGC
jgi:hypothetical protein